MWKKLKTWFKDRRFENECIKDFKNKNRANKKTILILEVNTCHFECLPGISRYFSELGYDIDLILPDNTVIADDIFCRTDLLRNIRVFQMPKHRAAWIFKSFPRRKTVISKYKAVYINSNIIHLRNNLTRFLDFIPFAKRYEHLFILAHYMEYVEAINKGTQYVSFRDFQKYDNYKVVNPHYFGMFDEHVKNNVVHIVMFKRLVPNAMIENLFQDMLKELLKTEGDNFKFTIIGNDAFSHIKLTPEEKKKVTSVGRLSFGEMYNVVESADFILLPFDSDIDERYIERASSGNFQLIYGFNTPGIMEQQFAEEYDFDEQNSITYNDIKNVINGVKKAIAMSQDEYASMCSALGKKSDELYKYSLSNLELSLRELD